MNLLKKIKNPIKMCLLFVACISTPVIAAEPVVFYSDLLSGPNTGGQDNKGAFVTLWGKNFGASQGESYVTVGGGNVDNYPEWTDTQICFQLGSNARTGQIVVHTNNGTETGDTFTVRDGNILFISVDSPNDPGTGTYNDPYRSPRTYYETANPGDIGYFRAGTYNGTYGYTSGGGNFVVRVGSGSGFCNAGTEEGPIAYVAYPNEEVIFDALGEESPTWNFRIYSSVDPAWYVISKFQLKAYNQCVGSAATGWRIVGNDCLGITRTTELQAGIIGTGGKSAKILGNKVHGGRSGSKMDHAIYPGACPSGQGIEVGWNHIYDNNFARGPLISINHENTRCDSDEYVADAYVHDNIIDATNFPCRAISVFHLGYMVGEPVEPSVYIYNNILINCGITDDLANHPAIVHQNGHAYIYHNTFYNTRTRGVAVYSYTSGNSSYPTLSATIQNNIFHMRSNADHYIYVANAYQRPLTVGHNNYYGLGDYSEGHDTTPINGDPGFVNPEAGDFSLRSDSPCIDKGILINSNSADYTFDIDKNGVVRDSSPDPGVYEYSDGTATYECSDGIDNDGDGNIDFPADLGCSSSTDDNETEDGGSSNSENPSPSTTDSSGGGCFMETLF